MKMIELHWNDNEGEGVVKYSKTFNESHFVMQLDMLRDCIFDLQNKYNEFLEQPESEKNL
jgi:hypothetical protein